MFGKSKLIRIALILALCLAPGLSAPVNTMEQLPATAIISPDFSGNEAQVLAAEEKRISNPSVEVTSPNSYDSASQEEMRTININLEMISSGLTALPEAETQDAASAKNEDKAKYYVLENSLRITNASPATCRGLKLEVPLMAEIDSPYQEMVGEEFSMQPTIINAVANGNRIGTFTFEDIAPGGDTVFTQRYTVKVDGSDWLQAQEKAELEDLQAYLVAAPKIECTAPEIQAIASQINSQVNDEDTLALARTAFEFAHTTLTYDSTAPSANKGALAGLQARAGVCEEFASLFVATCRASGIPARIVNGYASDARELAQDDNPVDLQGRRHQWAEFYLDGKGWIPVDPTLTNSVNSVFGELPAGYYVAQNYGDSPIRGSYRGGQVGIGFEDKVAKPVN